MKRSFLRHLARREAQSPPHIAQLKQFIDWIIPTSFIFAVLAGLTVPLYGSVSTGIAGAVVATYGLLLLFVRKLIHWGRWRAAILLICLGLLAAITVVTPLQPRWSSAIAFIPLLVVAIVLPHASSRVFRWLLVGCWLVTVGVALAGEILPTTSSLPPWFDHMLRVGGLAATVAVVMLLVWQFSSRLNEALANSQAAEQRFMLAVRGAKDGLWDWDLASELVYYSPRWKEMLGYTDAEIGDSPNEWLSRVHPTDHQALQEALNAHINGRTSHLEIEYRIRHRDGVYRWMLSRGLAVRDAGGTATRLAGSQTDITNRKSAEAQLRYDALHDALTGLPNRTLFTDRLAQAIERAKRHAHATFAVLFIDLDRFKIINDSLGHAAGDTLLTTVAQRLTGSMRQEDTVARLGGDEFAILLTDLNDESDAIVAAERIKQLVSAPLVLDGQNVFTTTSIGIAISTSGYQQPADIIRDADTAMYRAKTSGKNRYVVFDQQMHTHMLKRLHIEMDLQQALERGEFRVRYQPIVSLRTGTISGLEAVLRWHHPKQGCILPSEFLPVAEETGLLVPIGAWLRREACQQIAIWQQRYPAYDNLMLNVNLSAVELNHPGIVSQIIATLQESTLNSEHLVLEITEGMILDSNSTVTTVLKELRRNKLKLYLDDFGTGYASLSHLPFVPIKGLKIDHTFITTMQHIEQNAMIVRAIAGLAHSLNLEVIAEGVETEEHLAELCALECDYGQGHLFATPLDKHAVEKLLARTPQWQVALPRTGHITRLTAHEFQRQN